MMQFGISNIFKLVLLVNSLAVFADQPIVFEEKKVIAKGSISYVLLIFLAAFLVGFVYRALLRKFSKRAACKVSKNIGIRGRVLRIAIAILLFVWAITTNMSPFILFFSGFALFEGIFSWCGLYAALGKIEKE